MASVSAAVAAPAVARAVAVRKVPSCSSSSPVLGLPHLAARGGRVRCSAAGDQRAPAAALLAAASSMVAMPGSALALVDERMSTEGTGLGLGVSNNLLGWILLGIFGLIWSLYFIYTSSLDEDEDSALSL